MCNQKDINSRRWFSPGFLFMLVLISGAIWFLRVFATPADKLANFEMVMGFVVLAEVAIHLGHIDGITSCLLHGRPGAAHGRIDHSRWLLLSRHAAHMMLFGVLWLFLAFISHPRFFIAGSVACVSLGLCYCSKAKNEGLRLIPAEGEYPSESQESYCD